MAVWLETEGLAPGLRSGLGRLDTAPTFSRLDGHCPGRPLCWWVSTEPGQRILLHRNVLDRLDDAGHAESRLGPDEATVTIRVDHGPEWSTTTWSFLVLPIYWRDGIAARRVDRDIVLAVRLMPGADSGRYRADDR